jgi:hypothetical protein
MTVIKLIRDDIGLLSLYRQNKATIDLEGDVEGVEPYPTIRPMAPKQQDRPPHSRDHRRHTAQSTRSTRRQRGQDRRRQRRRQTRAAVILDTRSGYERRTQLRRTDDRRQSVPDNTYTGFDDFA